MIQRIAYIKQHQEKEYYHGIEGGRDESRGDNHGRI